MIVRNTAPLTLDFRFTPANGTAPRDIHVAIDTQESERAPLRVTIDWGDGHPDGIPFPGPPLSGLELAARYVALRIRDRVEVWGGGTVEPQIDTPVPYAHSQPLQELHESPARAVGSETE